MNQYCRGTKKVLLLMTTKTITITITKTITTVGTAVLIVSLMLFSYSHLPVLHSAMSGTSASCNYSLIKSMDILSTTIQPPARISFIFLQRLLNYCMNSNSNSRISLPTIHSFDTGGSNGSSNNYFVHSFQYTAPYNHNKYYNKLNFNNQLKAQNIYIGNNVLQRTSEQHQHLQQRQHSKTVLHMMINSRMSQQQQRQQQQQVTIQWQPSRNWMTTTASSSSSTSISTTSSLYMSGGDDYEDDYKGTTGSSTQTAIEIDTTSTKTMDSVWNIPNMTKEINRCVMRCHKKIGSIQQRITKVNDTIQSLVNNPQTTLQEYENSPDLQNLQVDLQYWQQRLQSLNNILKMIDSTLSSKQKRNSIQLPNDIATIALSLNISDTTPTPPPRGTKVKNRENNTPRKPYRIYYSSINDTDKINVMSSNDNNNNKNRIEIRVGKRAEDNDQLSINPEHRGSGNNWWMHASGCPGSHVVICTTDDIVPPNVMLDAASLAARYSKCFTSHNNYNSNIPVTITRCKYITKPKLIAPPGLVMITGPVTKLTINMKDAQQRIQRLETTVIN